MTNITDKMVLAYSQATLGMSTCSADTIRRGLEAVLGSQAENQLDATSSQRRNKIADRLSGHKFNSCTCESLRGDGQHESKCLTDAIALACEELRRPVTALGAQATPNGWVIVPQEMTTDMMGAYHHWKRVAKTLPEIWAGVLAAAPPAPLPAHEAIDIIEVAAKIAEEDRTPAYGAHKDAMEWLAETQRNNIATRIRALRATKDGNNSDGS